MPKLVIFIIKSVFAALCLLKFAIGFFLFYLNVLKIYFEKKECEKFKDCLLLARLKKQQPAGGDRNIEYPWMLKNIDLSEGRLLDVGSTAGKLLVDFLPEKVEITCLNLNPQKNRAGRVSFVQGDIRRTDFPADYFDVITCISTLEHIGVAGRYRSDEDPKGDQKAMTEMKRILKPGGQLLLTVPYGAKDVLPINKLYNKERLSNLFAGFQIKEQLFIKHNKKANLWLETEENDAAKTDMLKDGWYALCLIRLTKE